MGVHVRYPDTIHVMANVEKTRFNATLAFPNSNEAYRKSRLGDIRERQRMSVDFTTDPWLLNVNVVLIDIRGLSSIERRSTWGPITVFDLPPELIADPTLKWNGDVLLLVQEPPYSRAMSFVDPSTTIQLNTGAEMPIIGMSLWKVISD